MLYDVDVNPTSIKPFWKLTMMMSVYGGRTILFAQALPTGSNSVNMSTNGFRQLILILMSATTFVGMR